MTFSVCTWPTSYSECGACETLSSLPEADLQMYESMATEFLWRWTGQQFGQCEVTIRPCKQDCTEGLSTYGGASGPRWTPVLMNGKWYNLGCGTCGDNCGCSSTPALRFEQPVAGIIEIIIDGVALDPSAYRVDNNRFLVRQDGGVWPTCQNMDLVAGSVGTWSITYLVGAPVPVGGQVAAGKLACELAKAACGDKDCGLPQRWQTITRQGVTISAALDTFQGIDDGRTGIWLIDSWVASVTKAPVGFSIASPDYKGQGRRTTSSGPPNFYGGNY